MKPTEKGKKLLQIPSHTEIRILTQDIGNGYYRNVYSYRMGLMDYVIASNPTEIKALLDMGLIEFEK